MIGTDYVESWQKRVIDNAPKDETVDDVLKKMRSEKYMNRGRFAAYAVRLGEACKRNALATMEECGKNAGRKQTNTKDDE